jgi:CRISPR-associated protein Csd1
MNLLQQLREYELRMRAEGAKAAEGDASRGGEMPFMYALQSVRWEVRLHADGTVRDVQPLSSGKSKGKDLGRPTPAPNLVRAGSAAKPRLLMDNAEYVLGLQKKEGKAGIERAQKFHEAYVLLVQVCAEATNEPSVQAIDTYLSGHDPATFKEQHLTAFPDFAPDTNVMFSVDGVNPLELPAVRRFWAAQFAQGEEAGEGFQAECLITGEVGPVMEREPVKIKGIQGGQTSGMNFISANAQAFKSYGLQASQVAPVKLEVAEQYANGLNRLLADPNTSLKVGGVTYAFWTGAGAVPLVSATLREPPTSLSLRFAAQRKRDKKARTEEVRKTLWGLFTGQQPALKPGAAFYAVGLTPSGSRIAVRTHLTSTVQEVVDKLARFFASQAMSHLSESQEGKVYGVFTLARSLFFQKPKKGQVKLSETDDEDKSLGDDARLVVLTLTEHALAGHPLPQSYLTLLAQRNRAEKRVTRPRAVLTKMVLLSRDWKELDMDKDTLEALNPEQREPAYHLGRLLAVLDNIQYTVMPKANTTLVDRFYGSMSTTPYAVVGRLIQGSQAHLQKLRKENEPAYRAKQNDLESVMSRLHDIPAKPLSTAQQALFALGYYHQRAHIGESIRERSAAKKVREAQAKVEAEQAATQPALLDNEGDAR